MVKTKVSFAIKFIDDYTGRDITGVVHTIRQGKNTLHPIRKSDGYYVFVNTELYEDLVVESTHYKVRVIPKELLNSDGKTLVLDVRLYRSLKARFYDCEWIRGTIEPRVLALVAVEDVPGLSYVSSQQSGGKNILRLGGYTVENLCGKCFCIGEGKKRELFIITDRNSDGSYEISNPIKKTHREGLSIHRVYSGLSDEEGNFAIPVAEAHMAKVGKILKYEGEVSAWGCSYTTAPN